MFLRSPSCVSFILPGWVMSRSWECWRSGWQHGFALEPEECGLDIELTVQPTAEVQRFYFSASLFAPDSPLSLWMKLAVRFVLWGMWGMHRGRVMHCSTWWHTTTPPPHLCKPQPTCAGSTTDSWSVESVFDKVNKARGGSITRIVATRNVEKNWSCKKKSIRGETELKRKKSQLGQKSARGV